jgi:hypothetical protein
MKIDIINYKGLEITTDYNKEDKTFHAYSLAGDSHAEFNNGLKNFSHGYRTEQEAIDDVKSKIDTFINITPKNYSELAEQLTAALTWTGYESCRLDEKVVEVLVGNFIKLKH